MAWTIGGTTLTASEFPHAGTVIQFTGDPRWSKFRPIGHSGVVMTFLGTNEREHILVVTALEATKDAMKTLSDSNAAFKFIAPWDPLQTPGVDVVMSRFSATKSGATAGSLRYRLEMTLTEV